MRTITNPPQVIVASENKCDGEDFATSLKKVGIEPTNRNGSLVILTRNPLSAGLIEINRTMLRQGAPWLLVKTSGRAGWIGPLFFPGRTGCLECLTHRLQENCWQESGRNLARASTILQAVKAVRRWLIDECIEQLEGKIRTVSTSGLGKKIHLLTRRPQCPACGAGIVKARRYCIQSRIKTVGGLRTCEPDDTVKRLEVFESDISGIFRRSKSEMSWKTFPTYLGLHCCPLQVGLANTINRALQPVAGKGATKMEAKASCLAEAIERYSIQWQGDEIRRKALRSNLDKRSIDLLSLTLWSDEQLRHRDQWNQDVGGFHWIPALGSEATEIEWTKAKSLTTGRWVYVPTEYCYLYYPKARYCADSNGSASGNVLEEAILHGFLELVERDAVAIWWYNTITRPAVALHGSSLKFYSSVSAELKVLGRDLCLLDITSDFGIPVFAAISARMNGTGVLIGTGAHMNPECAVRRALSELCQMIEALDDRRGQNPHGRLTTMPATLQKWLSGQNIKDHAYLRPSGAMIKLRDFEDLSRQDLRDELDWCIAKADRLDLEMLFLDMTRRDLGFPVARVIVPGMRHFWARFAPGRLYDVPVKLGILKHALREGELNPWAYFL